jgi:hypothetical protein
MIAVAHEIRNLCGAVLVVHKSLSRVQELESNEDFKALGSLIQSEYPVYLTAHGNVVSAHALSRGAIPPVIMRILRKWSQQEPGSPKPKQRAHFRPRRISPRQSFGMNWNESAFWKSCKSLKTWWPGTELNFPTY